MSGLISKMRRSRCALLLVIWSAFCSQSQVNAQITGQLRLDDSWEPTVYLSFIPSYEQMYVMSTEMILASSALDSLGFFAFNLNFLPKEDKVYRLHIVKREDSPATLIIGGKNENHFFFIANKQSSLHMSNDASLPPFRRVAFQNSADNTLFQRISQLVFMADSIASQSTAAKRSLIEKQLERELLQIADTASNALVSLYAVYKSKFESNHANEEAFYASYLKKWRAEQDDYFIAFRKHFGEEHTSRTSEWLLVGALFVLLLSFVVYRVTRSKSIVPKTETLSIQERKLLEFLKQGASNQEIANHFNIEMSTVKSHVSRIYKKMNVKSRKDLLDKI